MCSFFSHGNAVKNPKCLLITGGSSGLGRSLAIGYAKPGVVIGITGRSRKRLREVAEICTERGAKVEILEVDVVQREELQEQLVEFDNKHPIDILIANAGISAASCGVSDINQQYYDILSVNTIGVLNTVLPLIPSFKNRKKGQLVLMGSMASYLASFSIAHPYCASKVALNSLAASWRLELKSFNVGVTLIAPAYVKTPMTDLNTEAMPLIMSSDAATSIMIEGIAKDYAVIPYPTSVACLSWVLQSIPPSLLSMVAKYVYSKHK